MTIEAGDAVAGRYLVSRLLGQGNMGRVWEAVDPNLDRRVALKEVLLPPDAEQAQRDAEFARLQREARMIARLDHPNAVSVHDVARHNGAPVIVMQFVPLPSLRECINNGTTWSAQAVARIGQLTVAALRHAHARGVVHKDIKPDNVLYAPSAPISLKVTDFGIARDMDSTTTSKLMGTPAYMAPEQWQGEKATEQSDLWALGVMLFELAEGGRPFDGPHHAAVMHAVFNRPVPAMSQAGELAPVIEGLLTKDPKERMDAEEAERLLQAVADGHTVAPTVPVRPQPSPTLKLPDAGPSISPKPVKKEELGSSGKVSNLLATMLNLGVGVAMWVTMTQHLVWESAEYRGTRVVTRAWGDNTVWPFTVVMILVFACACLGGLDWPARKDKSVGRRISLSIVLLFVALGFGVAGDTMTAHLAGLQSADATVDEIGNYVLMGSMASVLVSSILRGYATYADSAWK